MGETKLLLNNRNGGAIQNDLFGNKRKPLFLSVPMFKSAPFANFN
jgi:hypothetical protein